MLKGLLQRIKRLICHARAHDWPVDEFGAFEIPHEHALKFCKRCGAEFFGRTISGLRAMPFEAIEEPVTNYHDWSED